MAGLNFIPWTTSIYSWDKVQFGLTTSNVKSRFSIQLWPFPKSMVCSNFFPLYLSIASLIGLCVAVRFGMGNHVVMVSPRQLSDFGKVCLFSSIDIEYSWILTCHQLSFVGQVMFALAITFAKLSLLALYNRIFRIDLFRIIGNVAQVIISLWCIATLLVTIFNCHPIRFFWDKSIPNGHCLDPRVQTYSLSVISILTDIFVWVVPVPWLWRLILDWPKKIGLIATFALGGL